MRVASSSASSSAYWWKILVSCGRLGGPLSKQQIATVNLTCSRQHVAENVFKQRKTTSDASTQKARFGWWYQKAVKLDRRADATLSRKTSYLLCHTGDLDEDKSMTWKSCTRLAKRHINDMSLESLWSIFSSFDSSGNEGEIRDSLVTTLCHDWSVSVRCNSLDTFFGRTTV